MPKGMLWCHFVTIKIIKMTSAYAEVIFSFTFSKKIYHRRSLYHASPDAYHRFAQQIYITVDWADPYAQSTDGQVFSSIVTNK